MPPLRTKIALAIKYLVTGFSIFIVASSMVFIAYALFFPRQERRPLVENEKPAPTIAQVPEVAARPLSPTIPSMLPATATFTVYIASYTTQSPAEEEVSRWKEAGYTAAVVHANKHFRVALGRYATVDEAQRFATQMWDAFENGCWIGRIP